MREDWVEVEIENIFKVLENGKELNQGWSPQCKNYPSPKDDIWGVLKTTAIQKNEFWDHENKELPRDKEVRPHLEVKVGDILLTCAGPRNRCGVACTVIKTRPKLLLSGKMYRFRPDERVMTTEFLTFFLQTKKSWLAIDKMKTGTSDSGLNLTHARFRRLPVSVAPLPEQRAIVAKIEELFSDLDKGIADLKKAQAQLKIYRQAVLKKAFEGELTKEWREQQTNLPSADVLLEQIKEERQKHYAQQLENWTQAVKAWEENGKEGKKPGKPSKIKGLGKTENFSNIDLVNLPNSWCCLLSEYISDFITKGTTPKSSELFNHRGEVPFLKVYNLTFTGELDFSINPTFVNNETHNNFLQRSKAYPNDILMNIVGPPLGKVSIVPDTYPEWNMNQAIVRFRPYSSILHKYLALYLMMEWTVHQVSKKAKATAGQFNLTLEICRQIIVPICSKEEQHHIVREIESRLSVCDKVEQSIAESLEKAQALRQSILKKAFEGSLLSAEEIAACKAAPDYEPASVLLEKIKAETLRQAQGKKKKSVKKVKA